MAVLVSGTLTFVPTVEGILRQGSALKPVVLSGGILGAVGSLSGVLVVRESTYELGSLAVCLVVGALLVGAQSSTSPE